MVFALHCVFTFQHFQIVNTVLATRVDVNGRLESFRESMNWCTWCEVKKRILLAVQQPSVVQMIVKCLFGLCCKAKSFVSFSFQGILATQKVHSFMLHCFDRCYCKDSVPLCDFVPKLVAALLELCCYIHHSGPLFTRNAFRSESFKLFNLPRPEWSDERGPRTSHNNDCWFEL